MKISEIIGSKIKELRLKNNLTLEKLAYESGISKSGLSEIERGLKEAKISTLYKITERLDVKLSDFIKLIEAELPEKFEFIDK
jgi:XRE family transcriptional regulator, regulator of sulfur utilization